MTGLKLRSIPFYPILDPRLLSRRANGRLPSPLETPRIHFYGYARVALYDGLRMLSIKEGDNVLIPSFICDSVIAPFSELRIRVKYYEVERDLNPNLESAAAQLDERTRALLAVHYFGVPHQVDEVKEFCRSRGLYYIEDNAHGFLSLRDGQPLGTFGDISVMSLRKTLPIPNGAALVINNPNIGSVALTSSGKMGAGKLKFYGRSLLQYIEGLSGMKMVQGPRGLYQRIRGEQATAGSEELHEEESIGNCLEEYSPISRSLLKHLDYDRIARTRKISFQRWMDFFERSGSGFDVEPVVRELPPGVVPFAFPLMGESFGRIEQVLAKAGIESMSWPALPRASKGWRYGKRVLLLPVHTVAEIGEVRR